MTKEHSNVENEAISDDDLRRSWRCNSTPKKQFDDLIVEEMGRIWDSDPVKAERSDKVLHVNCQMQGGWLYDQAFEEVRAQWIEQGIWKDSWGNNTGGPGCMDVWKHEEPLQCVFLNLPNQTGHEARSRPKWKADIMHQHDASRPINQFIYQVTNECERLADRVKKDDSPPPGDIYSQAYEIVRGRWVNRHIWDDEWGVLPGTTWQHEKPLNDFTDSEPESESEYYSSAPPTPTLPKTNKDSETIAWTKGTTIKTKGLGKRKLTTIHDEEEITLAGPLSKRQQAEVKFADMPIEVDTANSYNIL
ncbi:hypothetical protein K449DRAFT_400323 [Hypoxylon sp. EC38]|nr:hypothetical protein K449DRAFT_400323 [Hypoxylon sp. EC38]